jgi:glycerate kinase
MHHATAPKTVRALIAPDKFKGSLTAGEVADALATGFRSATGAGKGTVHCELLPLADGGDGSVDAAIASASSRGFGEAVLFALSMRPARIVMALGGSASTDGGMGMLTAWASASATPKAASSTATAGP